MDNDSVNDPVETQTARKSRPWTFHALMALAALGVLAAAGYLRLRGLRHSQMGGDQSVLLRIAVQFVMGGDLPLAANKSSAGIMNPPLLEYLIALPLMIKPQIISVVIFFALLNLTSVLVCYGCLARLYGYRVAFIATVLYAFNPYAVYFSRFIWNPNPIPFFSTLLLCSLLAYFTGKRRPILLILSFLWLAAVIQLHLASLVIAIVFALILLLFRSRVSLRHVILGGALFGLTFVPYLIFVYHTGFTDVGATFDALGGAEAIYSTAAALIARDLTTGRGIFTIAERGQAVWQAAVWPLHRLMDLEAWLLVTAALYAAGRAIGARRRKKPRRALSKPTVSFIILLIWLLVPLLLYIRHTIYLQNFYFLYLYPAPFVLIALAADDALKRLTRLINERVGPRLAWMPASRAPVAATALLIPILAIGVWQFHLFHTWLALADEGLVGHRRRVAEMDRLITTTRRVMNEHPGCGLIVVSEGYTPETSHFGALEDFRVAADVRYVQRGRGLIIPQGCAVYLDTSGSDWLTAVLGDHINELPEAREETGQETWRFYVKAAGAGAVSCAEALGEWENGLALCAVDVWGDVEPGQPIDLVYFWQATRPTDDVFYHFYNHLINLADEQLAGQEDGPGVHAFYWRTGETFVTRFLIPTPVDVPSSDYEVRVGLYVWPDLLRIPLTDGREGLPVWRKSD